MFKWNNERWRQFPKEAGPRVASHLEYIMNSKPKIKPIIDPLADIVPKLDVVAVEKKGFFHYRPAFICLETSGPITLINFN